MPQADSAREHSGAKRRGVEDLVVTHTLRHLGTARLPVDEAVVQAALTPMHVGAVATESEARQLLGAVLRTGTVFVLNPEDVPGFGSHLSDATSEPWDGLPPLPFPRIWIECGHPDEPGPIPFPYSDGGYGEGWSAESDWSGLFGVGIIGDEHGWAVVGLWEGSGDSIMKYPWDTDAKLSVDVMPVAPDGSSHYPLGEDPFVRERQGEQVTYDPIVEAMTAWRAILLVNLIDVLGARHVPLDIPRPHRRAHERQFGSVHPSVYFIDLRQAGEKKPGSGDREYHCRWMVRGHWRHFEDGRRTWVRPYVKGPVGAPWRGRPIYADRKARGGNHGTARTTDATPTSGSATVIDAA